MKTQLSKPARSHARYTEEYKKEALELWRASGRSAAKVAAELGIRAPLLYRWANGLAFTAENRQQVEAFYRAAIEAGGKDNGAPGLCPDYHANYYAAFVIGPDGHNIEVVCHESEA